MTDIKADAPDIILEIGRRLLADKEKNSHFTADPMFTVQREVRVYWIEEGEGDGAIWLENGEHHDDAMSSRLERRYKRGWPIPERFDRVEYKTNWEFVDAYLTPQAAEERVAYMNRKGRDTYRTYVESGCRNGEWKAVQAYLMALAKTAEVKS